MQFNLNETKERLHQEVEILLKDHTGPIYIFGYASIIWNPNIKISNRFDGFIRNFVRVMNMTSVDHRGTVEFPGRVANLVRATSDDDLDEITENSRLSLYRASLLQAGTTHLTFSNLKSSPIHTYDRTPSFDSSSVSTPVNQSSSVPSSNVVHGCVFELPESCRLEQLAILIHRERGGYTAEFVDVQCSDGIVRKSLVFLAPTTESEFLVQNECIEETANIVMKAKGISGKNSEYFLNLLSEMRRRNVYDPYLEVMYEHCLAHDPSFGQHLKRIEVSEVATVLA